MRTLVHTSHSFCLHLPESLALARSCRHTRTLVDLVKSLRLHASRQGSISSRCVSLPQPALCGNAETTVLCPQTFKAVSLKSYDTFKGLGCNPHILSVPFGKKVSELQDHGDNKWPYSPRTVIEVVTKLWQEAESLGSFDG